MKTNLSSKIEALLFVAGDDGLTLKQLQFLTEVSNEELQAGISELHSRYDASVSGIALKELAGVFQLVTKPEVAETIQKLVENPTVQALSQASLEVLAIIAYKQPITRVEVEDLRGVKSEKALQTLTAKGLVQEAGRVEGTGRAILYGTTSEFLNYFGLKSLDELPPLPEEAANDLDEDTDLFMTNFQEAFKEEVKV
ncbi:SMC-Scp complex subunit ScpB [Planococcus kocurii]|uniref:Segregation and condensation protein B n=2 Tax=Planococcus TaxID=1372 RepID=A0ABN4JTK7_9BACL|nr:MULTISPECIES: SMC-Scp complex subunit ScpB [Planococcus]ALS78351.1 segregation and condensation protein B [Planococcus kocurii]AQU79669.1 segregation/condensation protein B [Planococcus faecalis]KAA0958240.1 SMC-Scp complex subunit ScpB [Planococcus sp. ANT_H30]OHX51587.1 SMC-Scp complex subunit ScpB [Planococcus faecalis]